VVNRKILPEPDEKSKFRIVGMFAGDPELTVDRFLERKHAEKELDL